MTSAERKSIKNGIWMCRTHAKLIDSDESTYTVDDLHASKKRAEAEAEQRLRTGTFEPLTDRTDLQHELLAKLTESQRQLGELSVQRAGMSSPILAIESGLHGEIDDACEYMQQGQPQVTIDLLEKIDRRKRDQLSPRERYRVLANIGNAKLAQRDHPGAAHAFLGAAKHQPTDEDARALEALAYQLRGDHDTANELATSLAKEHPELSRAHMIRIRTAPEDISFEELSEAVPRTARNDPEVALALHDRAVSEGYLEAAEQFLRNCVGPERTWPQLKLALACTILQQEQEALTVTVEGPVVANAERLKEASDLYTQAIEAIPKEDTEGIAFVAYLNRGNARALLGELDLAEEDIRRAYDLEPGDERAAIALARLQYPTKDLLDEAIGTLERYLNSYSSLSIDVLLVKFLMSKGQSQDLQSARALAERIQFKIADIQQADLRVETVAVIADLYIETGDGTKAEQFLTGLNDALLSNATRSAILGDVLRRLGRESEAAALAQESIRSLGESNDRTEVVPVAHLLQRLGKHAEAFRLWRRIVAVDSVTDETIQLLMNAQQAGEHQFVLDFCRQLRAGGHYDPRSHSIEVTTLTDYSEFQEARKVFLEYLEARPDDKIARLNLTGLALRLEWPDLVDRKPSNLPAVDEVETAEIGSAVSDVLRAGPEPIEAVNYAYALYRRFPEESEAHRALIVSVFAPGTAGLNIEKPENVAPGTAACYREVGAEEIDWVVIEDSKDPSVLRHEFPDSNPLALEMIGKTVGDEFRLPGRREPIAEILEIRDKRVFRANELMESWTVRFPDKPTFEAVPIKKSDSPSLDDFAEMTKILAKDSETTKKLERFYIEGRVPISSLAKLSWRTVFETVAHLAGRSDRLVHAWSGAPQDYSQALSALDKVEAVVLESSAITTLHLIEQIEILEVMPFSFLVTESTLDELRSLTREDLPQPSGYISYEGGRIRIDKLDKEVRERRLRRLLDLRNYLNKHCKVIGGSDLASIDIELRNRLTEVLTAGSAESVAAAHKRDSMLWTDDHLLYQLVKDDLPIKRSWTDVLSIWALEKNHIKREHRSRIVARMLQYGYSFTSSNAGVVLDTCEAASWLAENPDLEAVLENLGSTNLAPDSARGIVLETVSRLWREAPSAGHARAITARLLAYLANRSDHAEIVQTLSDNIDGMLGLAIARKPALRNVIAASQVDGALTL